MDLAAPRPLSTRVVLLLVSGLSIMSGAIIAPALPAIEMHFADRPHADVLARLVLTAPAIAIAIVAPFIGALVDRYGRRTPLIIVMTLYGVAGLAGLVVDDLAVLLASRLVLGLAVAGLLTVCTTLGGDYFQGDDRGRFLGLQTSFQGFGGLVLVTVGGLLAELSWRGPFALYGLSLLMIPAALAWLPEPARAPPRSAVATDAGGKAPAMALAILLATCVAGSAFFYLVPTQTPFLMRGMGIESSTASGAAIGGSTIAFAFASMAYQRLRRRLAAKQVFALCFALMACGCVMASISSSLIAVVVSTAAIGSGMGLLVPNAVVVLLELSPVHLRGRLTGAFTAATFLGQFVSPLLSQPVVNLVGVVDTFRLAAAALAMTAGLTLALRLPRRAD